MDRHESKAEEERNGWGRVKTYQPGRLLMKNVRFLGKLTDQTFFLKNGNISIGKYSWPSLRRGFILYDNTYMPFNMNIPLQTYLEKTCSCNHS